MSTVKGASTISKMDIVAHFFACFAKKISTYWEKLAPAGWHVGKIKLSYPIHHVITKLDENLTDK